MFGIITTKISLDKENCEDFVDQWLLTRHESSGVSYLGILTAGGVLKLKYMYILY